MITKRSVYNKADWAKMYPNTFNGETTPRHTFLCSDSQMFAPR